MVYVLLFISTICIYILLKIAREVLAFVWENEKRLTCCARPPRKIFKGVHIW